MSKGFLGRNPDERPTKPEQLFRVYGRELEQDFVLFFADRIETSVFSRFYWSAHFLPPRVQKSPKMADALRSPKKRLRPSLGSLPKNARIGSQRLAPFI